MTLQEKIDELRRLEQAATSAPWNLDAPERATADAAFIAAARNALPALLEVAEAAAWLLADGDRLDKIDDGFTKLTAALARLEEVK